MPVGVDLSGARSFVDASAQTAEPSHAHRPRSPHTPDISTSPAVVGEITGVDTPPEVIAGLDSGFLQTRFAEDQRRRGSPFLFAQLFATAPDVVAPDADVSISEALNVVWKTKTNTPDIVDYDPKLRDRPVDGLVRLSATLGACRSILRLQI